MAQLRRADGTAVDEATAQRWFPDQRPPPESGCFEIGIALAGAVSGGAYAAGVLDFLFEALDAWEAAQAAEAALPAAQRRLPGHRVRIPAMTGASAGSINGAIAAVVATRRFAAARYTAFGGERPRETLDNPFYRTWVQRIDLAPLLDTDDLAGQTGAPSLLNSRVLGRIADELLDETRTGGDTPFARRWLGPHWRLGFTLTNLDGVVYPWDFNFAPQRQQHLMRLHGDVRSFAVPVTAAVPAEAYPPDVCVLPPTLPAASRSLSPPWQDLAQTALGSAAFPAVLASRTLSRPADDYRWRFTGHVGDDWLQASAVVGDPYSFTCVDGGAIDNEPFEQVHAVLAGSRGQNPRSGEAANRAILLLDPFNDDVKPQTIQPGLAQRLIALFSALLFQARFDGRNVALASDDRIYSRYLVAPSRHAPADGFALAASGLGAFLGFFSEAYRHHDFFLGRANAQRFLRDYFTLPPTNPLIAGHWSAAALANPAFRSRGNSRSGECQIIPLVDGLDTDLPLPQWPKGALDLAARDAISDRIDARIKALLPLLIAEAPVPGWLRFTIRTLFGGALRSRLRSAIRSRIDAAVSRVDLG